MDALRVQSVMLDADQTKQRSCEVTSSGCGWSHIHVQGTFTGVNNDQFFNFNKKHIIFFFFFFLRRDHKFETADVRYHSTVTRVEARELVSFEDPHCDCTMQ